MRNAITILTVSFVGVPYKVGKSCDVQSPVTLSDICSVINKTGIKCLIFHIKYLSQATAFKY